MIARTPVAAAVFAVFFGVLEKASAEEAACGEGRAWVLLDSAGLARDFARRVEQDLGAELSANQIDVCKKDGVARATPIATIVISASTGGSSSFSIDVTDLITRKRVGRDVDVGKVPEDGRSFALAVAADELLRASWAELAIDRAAPAATPPPAPPIAPLGRDAAPRAERSAAIPLDAAGARLAFESYTRGHAQLGGDAFWAHSFGSRFHLDAAFGVRAIRPLQTPQGSVSGSTLCAQVAAGPSLVHGSVIDIDASIGLAGSRVTYFARPSIGSTGSNATGYALFARGGLSLSLGKPNFPVRSRIDAGLGAPLRSFAAADDRGVVAGLRGVEIFASTGVAVEF